MRVDEKKAPNKTKGKWRNKARPQGLHCTCIYSMNIEFIFLFYFILFFLLVGGSCFLLWYCVHGISLKSKPGFGFSSWRPRR